MACTLRYGLKTLTMVWRLHKKLLYISYHTRGIPTAFVDSCGGLGPIWVLRGEGVEEAFSSPKLRVARLDCYAGKGLHPPNSLGSEILHKRFSTTGGARCLSLDAH